MSFKDKTPKNKNDEYQRLTRLIPLIEQCLRENRYEDAIIFCQDALKIDPKCAKLVALAGDAHYQAQNFQDARRYYELAYQMDPSIEKILAKIDSAKIKELQCSYISNHSQSLDKPELLNWKELDNYKKYIEKGDKYFLSRQMKAAMEEYEKAYVINRKDPYLLEMMGDVMDRLVSYSAAKEYYEECLKITPNNDLVRKKLENVINQSLNTKKAPEISIYDLCGPGVPRWLINAWLAKYGVTEDGRPVQQCPKCGELIFHGRCSYCGYRW